MKKWHVLICFALWCALGSGGAATWAQQAADPPAQDATEEGEAADDDSGSDEDVFTPSEAIEADSEISFPADI